MAVLGVDLTQLPLKMRQSIDSLCRDQKAAALVAAKARQARMAKWLRDNPPRAIEGLGGNTMHFDPHLWSLLREGTKAAPGEDGEVQDWLARKHPDAFRVRYLTTKLQVGYLSRPRRRMKDVMELTAVTRGGVRSVKSYGTN